MAPASESSKYICGETPARLHTGRCGTRPPTDAWLRFRQDHAVARDAVHSEFSASFERDYLLANHYPLLRTRVADRRQYILNPPMGKRLSFEAIESLSRHGPTGVDVQPVITDGLSAEAVEANVPELLPTLKDGCELSGFSFGKPVAVRFGRVAVADQIGEILQARVVVNLIGERPGLSSGVGLSAYITYNPSITTTISSHRTVVSNISGGAQSGACTYGTPPPEAGAYITYLLKKIFEYGVSGVSLQQRL
ncbi:ethanolamine ammonia-lyase subunit EutC [bacterium]|nr:ethanolamine ammonia-lyase subunit EutC [bacterium]